eukprot:scaffold27715_cov84-Amphora_coffeaeformis.AAC.1
MSATTILRALPIQPCAITWRVLRHGPRGGAPRRRVDWSNRPTTRPSIDPTFPVHPPRRWS